MYGAKINRQPGPLNENALQMLRDKNLKKFSKVVTSDDNMLGNAVHLRLRQGEANVELKPQNYRRPLARHQTFQ